MKIFWSVLFYNLLAFGLFCGVLIFHPAQIKALMKADLQAVGTKVSSDATDQMKKVAPNLVAPTPTPKPTPPPAKDVKSIEELKPSIEAVFMGDYLNSVTEAPPPPELYPFSLSTRQFLDDGSLLVEILIRNESGFHFINPTVLLRSSSYPRMQSFLLTEWRDGEVALFKYKFPQSEVTERLTNLRVRLVKGEIVDSPLTEEMRKQRELIHRQLLGETDIDPQTGEKVEMDSLQIIIPEDTKQIAFEMENRVTAKSVKDRQLVDTITEAHQLALEVQELMLKFANDINNQGFEKSMVLGDGLKLRDEIKSKRSEFSILVTRVYFQQSRNSSSEVDFQPAIDEVATYSSTLLELATLIDSQIPLDKYKLQQDSLSSN